MPRSVSSPHTTRVDPGLFHLARKPSSKRQGSSADVLELSGSDDTPLHLLPKHHRRLPSLTTKKKPKPKAQIQAADVIEISSDEDDVPFSQESLIADLRSQVTKLKQENERNQNNCTSLIQELTRSRTELKEAKVKASQHQSTNGKLVLEPSEIDDTLNCEICARRMYTPNLLPDCGHTFCLSCLRDWFGTTHARFTQAHPHLHQNVMNLNVQHLQAILRPEYLAHPQLYHQLQELQQPTPEYTCPACRKRVYRRPVEVYTLKSLVRTISAAEEGAKVKIPLDEPCVERRNGHLVVVDPWDDYFPREQ